MKFLQPNTWNERQQVAAIIAMTCVVIVVLWVLVLTPLHVVRRDIERQIADKRAELQKKNLLFGEDVLRDMKRVEMEIGRRIEEEWAETTERLSSIETLREDSEMRVGHIDFKVALYETRFRMSRKARALGINLPPGLGMEETVPGGEDARKLLHQLRALERLVDIALDLNVGAIRELQPLPPIRHAGPDGGGIFDEYPVRVRFEADIAKIHEWFRATLQPGRAFAVRSVRIDGAPKGAPAVLSVSAVMSALVFLRDTSEWLGPIEERVLYTEPLGH